MDWDWLKPRKVMGIAVRLALVVGVIAGAWSFLNMHWKYVDAYNSWYRIETTLQCAKRFTDEELAKYKNPFGLIDLGKTYCGPRAFLASMEEIRDADVESIDEKVAYGDYVRPAAIPADALLFGTLAVVALGLAVVLLRWLTHWVLGIRI